MAPGDLRRRKDEDVAPQRRQAREDAIRWIASVTLAAMLASAATSAVFLAVRPKPAPPPSELQLAAKDQRQFKTLLPLLEAAVQEELARGTTVPASGPKQVDVVVEVDHTAAQRVPMVSTTSNMLTEATVTPWRIEVASVQDVRRFARVVDIRRSPSLRHPGYVGVVEFEVDRLERHAQRTGQLPAETPPGFEVITVAKYNELEESKQFERQVVPASSLRELLLEEHYENWQPVSPVPENLPAAISQPFHAALAACDSAEPSIESRRETWSFYYHPQAGTWTPQPRGEPKTSASP
jgi:hypothetical protein